MWNAYKDRNMILNVDGNNLGNPNVLSNISYSNTLHVELVMIYHGLRMAYKFGIKDLMCYFDSNSFIKLIS